MKPVPIKKPRMNVVTRNQMWTIPHSVFGFFEFQNRAFFIPNKSVVQPIRHRVGWNRRRPMIIDRNRWPSDHKLAGIGTPWSAWPGREGRDMAVAIGQLPGTGVGDLVNQTRRFQTGLAKDPEWLGPAKDPAWLGPAHY